MKVTTALVVVLLISIGEALASTCPRTNKKPGSECVDECLPSVGCRDSNKACLCDGDCGYSCVKKALQCSALKRLRNGKIVGKERNFNSTVKFVCDAKYTLFGPSTRRCSAKGLWDGKKSRCKISCPDPGIPDFTDRNRKQSAIGFSERTTLRYNCFPGYKTTDSLSIKCQKNKKWTSSPPVCAVQQCGKVKLPAKSRVRIPRGWRNKASHKLGTRILVTCVSGYRSPITIARMTCLSTGWKLMQPRFVCQAKSCGDPGTPRNGKKIGLSYAFNEVVRYSCNHCFTLTGASYRQCLADGSWSDSLPKCERVICSNPGQLTHGTLSLSSHPIFCDSYARFKCTTGYKLKGKARTTCRGDGKWSDSKPTCELVDCGDPGNPNNGLTTANGGFTYGNDARFSCNYNYVLEGSVLATCQSDGKWSKNLPRCLEKCSDPSRKTNARVIGKEFYHGKEVEFVCPRDSTLLPKISKKLTCEDGQWKGTIPSCKASCPSLSRLSNGNKRGRYRTHGSYVQFSCYRGYKLAGSSRVQCNDGRWSSQMPRCLAICRTIRTISRGWVYGNSYLEGDDLSFRCRQDYVLVGEKVIRCTGNRRWNASKPNCRAPCRQLGPPASGFVKQQGFRHKEDIHFGCDVDYTMQGKRILTCSDGRWNGVSPNCLAPCKRYVAARPFPGGFVKKDGFRHDEEVTFDCRDPLVIDGQATLRCNNGRWSDKLPSCGAPCKKLAAPKDGVIIKKGYKHKDELTFGCRNGFQLVGSPDRLCNFGVWNNPNPPRCEKKCSDPSKDTNARVRGNEFYNGKEVEFVCPKNHVLAPEISRKLTCVSGRWKGRIPTCKAPCPVLSQIHKGYIIGKARTHGSFAQFKCNAGHQRIGAPIARCDDGNWSEKLPQCAAPCPVLSQIPKGYIIGKVRTHGSVAQFKCNAGHQLIGAPLAQCDDGNWSEKLPQCTVICGKISPIKNGHVNAKGRLEGDEISFTCDQKYTLEGEKVLRCTSAGTWNASEPQCKVVSVSTTSTTSTTSPTSVTTTQVVSVSTTKTTTSPTPIITTQGQPKNCPDIKKTRKGSVKGSGLSPGSKRTFVCVKNWVIFGAKELTCLNNGKWSGLPPRCVPKGPQKSCSTVGPIKGGHATINESFHGGRVVFECDANYTMEGKPGRMCKSGRWSREPPKCMAPCRNLDPPKHGYIHLSSGRKHKDIIVFRCNQSYTLKGTSTLQCNDGSWSALPPICEKTKN